MGNLFTPQNNQKFTNVAIVRLKKANMRFELACYKNKLQDYRNNPTGTPLSDVVQSDQIFLNISKGLQAKTTDLLDGFGTTDVNEIIREILSKGEGQIGSAERSHKLENLRRDIAVIISEKTLNPLSGKPYTPSMIERVLFENIHLSIRPDESAKQQALDIIKRLEKTDEFPIVRRQSPAAPSPSS